MSSDPAAVLRARTARYAAAAGHTVGCPEPVRAYLGGAERREAMLALEA